MLRMPQSRSFASTRSRASTRHGEGESGASSEMLEESCCKDVAVSPFF
jgi:hypothetical protein